MLLKYVLRCYKDLQTKRGTFLMSFETDFVIREGEVVPVLYWALVNRS